MASFELIEPPALSVGDVDRADGVRADAERLRAGWPEARLLPVDHSGRFPLTDDGALRWSAATDFGSEPPAGAVLLGVVGTDRWALRVESVEEPAADARFGAARLSAQEASLLATALGLLNWHRAARFSPGDGTPTEPANGGWLRRTAAGGEEYPRTDPAVIMLVHDGADRVLLGRSSGWPERTFSTLAGFVETGESLEQCVRREVYEEAGVDVWSPRYLGSQPWPFPRSLMLGFEAIADPSQPVSLNDGELAEARWFHRDEVREALALGADWGADAPGAALLLPGSVSIARSLIDGWARGDKTAWHRVGISEEPVLLWQA
ncbi:MAG: NAD(+) diphosphatase [Gordonia sp. (in: high G+C Gram-positive bacteria)]